MAGSRNRDQSLCAGQHLASLRRPALGAWCATHRCKFQGYMYCELVQCSAGRWLRTGPCRQQCVQGNTQPAAVCWVI